jgi:hypothetical protein
MLYMGIYAYLMWAASERGTRFTTDAGKQSYSRLHTFSPKIIGR